MQKNVKLVLICGVFLLGILFIPAMGKSETNTLMGFEAKTVGYRINTAEKDMVLYDDGAYIELSKSISYQISVKSIFGDYTCKDLVIEEETIGKQEKYRRYEIENIRSGFFMEISLDAEFSYFSIAYDNDASQFIFEGLLWEGFDEFFGEGKKEATSQELSQIEESLVRIQKEQKENLKISVSESYQPSTKSYPITYTAYGVVHIPFDLDKDHDTSGPGANFAEDIADDYWIPDSKIDIGIYRFKPTETQVKSDLQYYNRDQYYLTGYSRDISAYIMITENNDNRK